MGEILKSILTYKLDRLTTNAAHMNAIASTHTSDILGDLWDLWNDFDDTHDTWTFILKDRLEE